MTYENKISEQAETEFVVFQCLKQTKYEPIEFVLSLVFYHFNVFDIKQMCIVSRFIVMNCDYSLIPKMKKKRCCHDSTDNLDTIT